MDDGMRQVIFLILSVAIACKAKQITDTQTTDKPKVDFHHGPEFNALPVGVPLDLGQGISVTKLSENLAAFSAQTRQITQKSEGSPSTFVLKDKSTVNINSGNTDKSKDKSKVNSDNTDKSKDKSKGDIDRSKTKTKVPSSPFLRFIWVFVLLLIGVIWFFAPRIKKLLKPPFL
jgi:ATP-dependent Zn protease